MQSVVWPTFTEVVRDAVSFMADIVRGCARCGKLYDRHLLRLCEMRLFLWPTLCEVVLDAVSCMAGND
ncbi:hypothetical protein DPMN_055338 [Dreissena polymorpha]|uniref:Uncharacterized protein n=1 Tax=Dreissena polymorpha TaxID=45954 RepID=A0A9D4HSH9_DREPO|nr:hypothetical protein DPMN_055338 [Dreissena polymorpha]